MKKILINSQEIESCWQTADASFIKMKSGQLWICQINTYNSIKNAGDNTIVEVTLANKSKGGEKWKLQ